VRPPTADAFGGLARPGVAQQQPGFAKTLVAAAEGGRLQGFLRGRGSAQQQTPGFAKTLVAAAEGGRLMGN
jgi:hypothetical protein